MGIIRYLDSEPILFFALLICLVFSLCFHEYAHGIVAYYLGDNTAYNQGRLTLNPIAHLDPVGSLMILFIGIGYAKPVPVNPYNLSNPRIDMIKVAAAGPISNLLIAFVTIFILYLIVPSKNDILFLFLQITIHINIALAIFNLIPIHPLDGGQIFGNFISKYNPNIFRQLNEYGPKVLFGLILFGMFTGVSIIWIFIGPFVNIFLSYYLIK